MEITRYINGVTVSEKELSNLKAITPEMTEAVNGARRRATNGAVSVVTVQKADG